MRATIRIPTPLRRFTNGGDAVRVEATTVAEALEDLDRMHPGIRQQVVDGDVVRRFVNIYVSDEDIRFLEGLGTPLHDDDVIAIIPAISGG